MARMTVMWPCATRLRDGWHHSMYLRDQSPRNVSVSPEAQVKICRAFSKRSQTPLSLDTSGWLRPLTFAPVVSSTTQDLQEECGRFLKTMKASISPIYPNNLNGARPKQHFKHNLWRPSDPGERFFDTLFTLFQHLQIHPVESWVWPDGRRWCGWPGSMTH